MPRLHISQVHTNSGADNSAYPLICKFATPFSQEVLHHFSTGCLWQNFGSSIFSREPNPSRGILKHNPKRIRSRDALARLESQTDLRVYVLADRFAYFLARYMSIRLSYYPCAYNFAKLFIRNCYCCSFKYSRMSGDDIFYLDREKVL